MTEHDRAEAASVASRPAASPAPNRNRKVRFDDDGARLDRWFARHYPSVQHALLAKEARNGGIRLNGKRTELNARVRPGDLVRVPPNIERAKHEEAEFDRVASRRLAPGPLIAKATGAVIVENEHVIVLNKPAGMAVQAGTGVTHALDDLLREAFPQTPIFPVHRLDRDTTGVLVFARTQRAAAALNEAFRAKTARKTYIALVAGELPPREEGEIRDRLAKTGEGYERVERAGRAEDSEGKMAWTRWKTLDRCGERFALMELEPLTGRTHQLRVHMAGLGCPVLGDRKYGDRSNPLSQSGTLMLHALRLRLEDGTEYVAPPPRAFVEAAEKLGVNLKILTRSGGKRNG